MDKTSTGDGACCSPSVEGMTTYLQVGPRAVTIGMLNLDTVFGQLLAMGRGPEEVSDVELLRMTRRCDYIPERSGLEADYAAALRRAYVAFCVRQERRTTSA